MAYDSDESGQGVDVFIQSFPDPQLKRVKVSPAHGSEPMWTQGGRELVYRDGDKVMAVSIDLATGASGAPRAALCGTVSRQSGVDPASQLRRHARRRALSPDQAAARRPRPRIMVVLNWFDELRAKVPR